MDRLMSWVIAVSAVVVVVTAPALRRAHPRAWWYFVGFPVTAIRVRRTWRDLAIACDLTVSHRPGGVVLGDLVVKGDPLRPVLPRLGIPRPHRDGLTVPVTLRPGQVPEQFAVCADAMAHAWRVHAVRVTSPSRGRLRLAVLAGDPLTEDDLPAAGRTPVASLRAVVGRREDGEAWVVDLRQVPHWLIVGATRSGKSTLLAAIVAELAPQPVALVGIDCKGGMELSLFRPRLTALATDRGEAAGLLEALVALTRDRMALCLAHRARSVWALPPDQRPVPVVVLVDELAELFLTAGKDDRPEAVRVATALLRLAQLGAALGVHLIAAGQRVGSDLGNGVTALRAQLGGRVCHRVNDPETAFMVLGDLAKDAVAVAQSITPAEQGVAVIVADDGTTWMRARSTHITPDHAQSLAADHAALTPHLPELASPAPETASEGRARA